MRSNPPPPVKDRSWIASPVDAFILARLEARGIAPSPAADRRTLIRRATIDLWGIPPTPEDVEAFEADRRPTPTPGWLTACWPPRDMANAGAATGSTSPDMPTPRAMSSPRSVGIRTLSPIAITSSTPSTPTCPTIGSSSSRSPPISSRSARARQGHPAAGRDGVPHGRPAVPARSERDHRRPDRRRLSRPARPDGHLCPVPRPQVRPDPDRRLLFALRRLRQLGRAGRPPHARVAGL